MCNIETVQTYRKNTNLASKTKFEMTPSLTNFFRHIAERDSLLATSLEFQKVPVKNRKTAAYVIHFMLMYSFITYYSNDNRILMEKFK